MWCIYVYSKIPGYTPAVNVITVDAYSLAGDITLKQSQATELKPGSFTTSKDGVDWVMMPDDYDENGYINEVRSRGKLYKLNGVQKSKLILNMMIRIYRYLTIY